MTPRQLSACIDLAIDRCDRDQAAAIEAAMLGARGAEAELKSRFSELAR